MSAKEIQSFDLPGVLDVDAMDSLRDSLNSALEIGDVRINGAEVNRVVTNALLMLASAKKTADKNQIAFSVANPSPALLEAAQRLGMNEILGPVFAADS